MKEYKEAWNDLFDTVLTESERDTVLASPSGATSMELGYAASRIAGGENKESATSYMISKIR